MAHFYKKTLVQQVCGVTMPVLQLLLIDQSWPLSVYFCSFYITIQIPARATIVRAILPLHITIQI